MVLLAKKEPILFYSGGDEGLARKWERLQLNTFMYSQEPLTFPKSERKPKAQKQQSLAINDSFASIKPKRTAHQRHNNTASALHERINFQIESLKYSKLDTMVHGNATELLTKAALRKFKIASSDIKWGARRKTDSGRNGSIAKLFEDKKVKNSDAGNKKNDDSEGTSESDEDNEIKTSGVIIKPSILALHYYDELDVMVAGSENSMICMQKWIPFIRVFI